MGKAMKASPPPSEAPTSPGPAAHAGDSNDQPSPMDPSTTKPGVDAAHSYAGSARTPPGDSVTNVLEVSDEAATARSNKRARAEALDGEDSLPSPKRVAEESSSEAQPTRTATPAKAVDGSEVATHDSKDDTNAAAEPGEQSRKSRRAPPKSTAAKPGRNRACAECKRRKVSEYVSRRGPC